MHDYPSGPVSPLAHDMAPRLHNCPAYIKDLIDPALRSMHVGPGFCTADNLFGVAYVLLLLMNYTVAFAFFCGCWKALCRFRWCRATWRTLRRTTDTPTPSEAEQSFGRAERGEGNWGKVKTLESRHISGC